MSKTSQEILMKYAGDILTVNGIGSHPFTLAMNAYADQRVSEALNSQWVSVKERLPEINRYVLAFYIRPHDGDKQVKIAVWENGWILHNTDSMYFPLVTHWQPLPSPPLNH